MWLSVLPLVLGLSAATLLQEGHWQDYKHGRRDQDEKSHCSWKCQLFTLQWPGAFCQSLDRGGLCQVPPTVNSWTIHGLWPEPGMRCCRCWPMFQSDVQELEAELESRWPSLLKKRSSFQFWKEEWNKHGVCAACVEGMNSPLRYFQISLKLHQRFHIHRLMEEAGITPSCDRPYKVAEVRGVLAPLVGDKMEIQCVTDDQDREVWFQVKIPLDRNLTVGCDTDQDPLSGPGPGQRHSTGHPCPAQQPFYYLPIDHERPERPCG
ncbi:uncharacterized protein V6R79_011294 [Siganus canaliculatus]